MDEVRGMSEAEKEIMKIIWESGGGVYIAELLEKVERNGKGWKRTTIRTFITRLMEKGLIVSERQGRLSRYVATVTEEEYLAGQAQGFVAVSYTPLDVYKRQVGMRVALARWNGQKVFSILYSLLLSLFSLYVVWSLPLCVEFRFMAAVILQGVWFTVNWQEFNPLKVRGEVEISTAVLLMNTLCLLYTSWLLRIWLLRVRLLQT